MTKYGVIILRQITWWFCVASTVAHHHWHSNQCLCCNILHKTPRNCRTFTRYDILSNKLHYVGCGSGG